MRTNKAKLERAIRTIRQRIFNMDEERQSRATKAIHILKSRCHFTSTARDYHWMYAAE